MQEFIRFTDAFVLRPCHGMFYGHVKYHNNYANLLAKVKTSAHRSQKAGLVLAIYAR